MKKLLSLAVFVAVLLAAVTAVAGQQVRVGLESRVNELSRVNMPGDVLAVGFEVGGQYFERAVVVGAGFAFEPDRSYYISGHVVFHSFEMAQVAASEYLNAVPCYVGNGLWMLYFGPFASRSQVQNAGLAGEVVAPNNRRIALFSNNGLVMLLDSPYSFPQISIPGEETFFVGSGANLGRYRGRLELGRFRGNNITGVNVLSMDEYLYSVVPAEMPRLWHPEALKAQAVASRTFAYRRIGHHAALGYDLCDRVCCQVFIGANNETEETTAAVRATSGVMAWLDGRTVSTNFSASSGGHTDNSENVWVTAYSHLVGVPDIYETTAPEWTRQFTLAELTAITAANNVNIGNVTGLHVARTANNRVQELVFTGTNGTHSLTRETIRTFFRTTPGGSLMSRVFTVSGGGVAPPPQAAVMYVAGANGVVAVSAEQLFVQNAAGVVSPLADNSSTLPATFAAGNTITITGRGNGHGVGMSQHGANGMANAGYTFVEILQWYFTGVEIRG